MNFENYYYAFLEGSISLEDAYMYCYNEWNYTDDSLRASILYSQLHEISLVLCARSMSRAGYDFIVSDGFAKWGKKGVD